MRTVPTSIASQLSEGKARLSRCVKIALRDGTELHFSDHDEDLEIDLGDGSYAATYTGDSGITSGDLDLSIGFDSSNIEIEFPISAEITRAAVLGRRFNQATVWIFDVDWAAEIPTPMALMKGWIAESTVKGYRAIFEVRSMQDKFNQVIGRILSPKCSATFGDADCGKEKIDVAAVVTAVYNSMEFDIDLAGTLSDGYFKFGEATTEAKEINRAQMDRQEMERLILSEMSRFRGRAIQDENPYRGAAAVPRKSLPGYAR
jgi:uncharacterized phage protein (TIGR02218 family)